MAGSGLKRLPLPSLGMVCFVSIIQIGFLFKISHGFSSIAGRSCLSRQKCSIVNIRHHTVKLYSSSAGESPKKKSHQQKDSESDKTILGKKEKTGLNKKVSPTIRRKMDLTWCQHDECDIGDLREKVVGDHNTIMFDHPATGQVAYNWNDSKSQGKETIVPRVLILVKRNDDELLKVAADAVRDLTMTGEINVMVSPDVAAKFSHYYSVDNNKIQLFDPNPVPGFGGNHLPFDHFQYDAHSSLDDIETLYNDLEVPDLVCTLGGDGLLMYASHLFPGPCPPILCVAGGSLGFLTPFPRDEMVESIRVALGTKSSTDEGEDTNEKIENTKDSYEIDEPVLSKFYRESSSMTPAALGQKVKFGANDIICLSMRMRLDCRVINKEGVVRARFNVLNEVVIDRGSSPYLAALECFCDDVHLTTVQADGIIFSTPTGSTAYSMAAGGSVVHPAVPAILVTPICPHVLSFRSMVFPDHVILRCYVPEDARADAAVAFDGKHRRDLHRGDSVQVRMSAHPVPTINKSDHSSDWLKSLKRNFNFNTRARQGPL